MDRHDNTPAACTPNFGGQAEFAIDDIHRYVALAGGWGSGKTWIGARKLLRLHALILCVALCAMTGCGGVQLSPTYSQLLDQTAALSAETAARAKAGTMTPAQMSDSLSAQAQTWQLLRDARDGKVSATQPATVATTQPAMPASQSSGP